ncbi:hypothetical protein JMUB7503_18070 [Staphylococcus aureus]
MSLVCLLQINGLGIFCIGCSWWYVRNIRDLCSLTRYIFVACFMFDTRSNSTLIAAITSLIFMTVKQ